MKRYRVQITARARSQLNDISRWWRENRPYHPTLFREEMKEAKERLQVLPMAGAPYTADGVGDVRRVLLPRTQHHVYYIIDEPGRLVTVLAIRHSARGSGPVL